jgi:hypothetical protein
VPSDCTSDPHLVSYGDVKAEKARLEVMFNDIIRVCESKMVMGIRSVSGFMGDIKFESDHYSDSPYRGKPKAKKKVAGPMAVKHKVAGLYWFMDAKTYGGKHLPPGLTGVKRFIEIALNAPDKFESLDIGVVWAFAKQASCSDYIQINDGDRSGDKSTVNYGSQDS